MADSEKLRHCSWRNGGAARNCRRRVQGICRGKFRQQSWVGVGAGAVAECRQLSPRCWGIEGSRVGQCVGGCVGAAVTGSVCGGLGGVSRKV